MLILPTNKRARPCSSMSGTKSSIGLGGRGVKALCGRATSWGQSSAEGTPTTLWGDNRHKCLNHHKRSSSTAVASSPRFKSYLKMFFFVHAFLYTCNAKWCWCYSPWQGSITYTGRLCVHFQENIIHRMSEATTGNKVYDTHSKIFPSWSTSEFPRNRGLGKRKTVSVTCCGLIIYMGQCHNCHIIQHK